MKDSGLEYRKIPSPDVVGYFVSVKRPTMGSFDVPIALVDSTVAIQARVARKSEIKVTPDLIKNLLDANISYDFVKIGFSEAGDLLVRYDARLMAVDGDEIKFLVNMVADTADDLAKNIAPFIKR